MPLHAKDAIRDNLEDDLYSSADLSVAVPKYKFPATERDPRHAYAVVHDELMLDGNSRRPANCYDRWSMTIRITSITRQGQTVIKVDGRLERADMAELVRSRRELGEPAALDLMELESVDRDGVSVLREVMALGQEVSAAAPYFELGVRQGMKRRANRRRWLSTNGNQTASIEAPCCH